MRQVQRKLLSGSARLELAPNQPAKGNRPRNYLPRAKDDCGLAIGGDVKVNQNCINVSDADQEGRGQAQNSPFVAQDPYHPNNLVASSNDYRRGDNNCYSEYSRDGGRTWNDTDVPLGYTRGTAFGGGAIRQYWQTGGDTSAAFDSRGNAYLSCGVFNRGNFASPDTSQSSGLYVFRSTGNSGASWNFPGRPVFEQDDSQGSTGGLIDKPLLTVDNHSGSPFQDRVYVTWTFFGPDGSGYIYEAHSGDYGETYSTPQVISRDSALCTNTYGLGAPMGNCNENQDSQPFTSPDGTVYIVYNNYNNEATKGGDDNRNQVFITKSVDGGSTFSAPQKVADYYDTPDCATYQNGKDFGRGCIPEKGATSNSFFRVGNYPSGAVDPTNPSHVVVTVASYISRHSNEANGCVPGGISQVTFYNFYAGVKTPGACNNDILLSTSNDKGATFDGTTTDPRAMPVVTTDPGQATSDQWYQWADFTRAGKLVVSYYDRQYGTDQTTGFSDFSVSAASGTGGTGGFTVRRVTSSSMPPPTQFAGEFWGDYTGLAALDNAHPVWSDTRPADLFLCPGTGVAGAPPAVCRASADNAAVANDQDIFTDTVGVTTR